MAVNGATTAYSTKAARLHHRRQTTVAKQQFEFFFAPDKIGQSARVHRLEAAFRRTFPQRRPGSHRPYDTLEVLGSKVVKRVGIEDHCRPIGEDSLLAV